MKSPKFLKNNPGENGRLKKIKTVTKFVRSSNWCTSIEANVCQHLSQEAIDVEPPSLFPIYIPTIKEVVKVKEIKKTLHFEIWSLHLDSKLIDGQNHQLLF